MICEGSKQVSMKSEASLYELQKIIKDFLYQTS